MKIFVTGASGFIGSHVTKALLSRGHSVAILTQSEETPWRLKEIYERIEKKPGKWDDLNSLRQAMIEFKPEACIHLAWYAEPGKYLTSLENLTCLKSSLNLFNELIQVGCGQIVAAGTCAEYAASNLPLTEDSPAAPTTLYAATKLSCGLLGRQLADLAKVHFAWGRIFYPYGPKEDERRLVPAVIKSLLKGEPFPATKGDQVRDYIHVEDVASAFCLMVEKQTNGVFNLSSGQSVTVRHLLETVGRLTGRGDLIQFGAKEYYSWELPTLTGGNQRLWALGWKPVFPLEKGLEKTLRWWEKHISPKS